MKMFNIKNRVFWITVVIINCLILIPLCLFYFGSFPDYSLNQKENTKKIGTTYMTMNNEYFRIINEEIAAKVETEGDQIILRDPSLSADRQIQQIQEMIDEGVDALVINPVNWKSLNNVLKQAKEKGIYVLIVDSDVYDSDLADITIKSNNYQAGQVVGNYFLNENDSANLVLFSHGAAKSSQDRIAGFLDTVKKNPNIKVVETIECQGQTEIAMPLMKEFIQKRINFDSVFCLNDLASLGVVAALDENNMIDKIKVYGVDASPDSKALIYEGMMKASAAQFPTKIGQETANALYRLFNDEKVEKVIEIPIELVTRENVSSYGIDRWQ